MSELGPPNYRPTSPAGPPPAGYIAPGAQIPAQRAYPGPQGPWPPAPPGRSAPQKPQREHNPVGAFLFLLVLALVATVAMAYGPAVGGISGFSLLADPAGGDEAVAPAPAVAPAGPLRGASVTALSNEVSPALVNVNVELGLQDAAGAGTGIVLSSTGEVLTNNHVINGATSIRVTDVGNGRSYPASVVGYDRAHDVAVLQLRGASGLRTAALGNSDTVAVGDPIAAIGNAGGVGGTPKTSPGQVVALGRSIATRDELSSSVERLSGLIEVAADVEPGDSGGPLVNASGQVIGMDTAASVNFRYQTPGGKGFAIPINQAIGVVHQIRSGAASGVVHIGPSSMLGVSVLSAAADALPSTALDGGDSAQGVPVAQVMSGSPAEQAGLAQGDTIMSFDGQRIDSADTLTSLVGQRHPGDQVRMVWLSTDGQQHDATVVLAAGPPS